MTEAYSKLRRAADYARERTAFSPRAALVLGSGLGAFADDMEEVASIGYGELPGFPESTVEGHRGRFVFGYERATPVVVMQGRVHYYEGYSAEETVMPVRLARLLGAETLILTNSAGAINADYAPGDFMLICDHILRGVPSPLIGPNIGELGPRFPDMSEVYSGELRKKARDAAARLGIALREGVYLQTSGPNFETPAEIRAYRALGADAVGMSTACEAIAARHAGMRVCGVSCVSNLAAGMSSAPLTHEDVQTAAAEAAPRFRALISELLSGLQRTAGAAGA
ncbi:MAG: purine-nucleoside phosphorylase [Oscillospiraceae bacterium]|jgi:purine-nucleoside phosphorylase|nr:purine-nucleoside phosphorylase [Oscillospiraceae bacterium]